MEIEAIHHVSLAVRDLERSTRFYREILGLTPIPRPPFDFPGAWFALGAAQQLHLIVHDGATFRGEKGINTRDGHFAVRVRSYRRCRISAIEGLPDRRRSDGPTVAPAPAPRDRRLSTDLYSRPRSTRHRDQRPGARPGISATIWTCASR